uniref:Uncharacterized protein n=1 Tax=Aegilops tauschii subsp. strangulata TaxID=200361 RepID=A0A453T4N5_AEGTS
LTGALSDRVRLPKAKTSPPRSPVVSPPLRETFSSWEGDETVARPECPNSFSAPGSSSPVLLTATRLIRSSSPPYSDTIFCWGSSTERLLPQHSYTGTRGDGSRSPCQ